jgi:hypothetical protein
MSEMFFCKCGFKCVEGQLAKSEGNCPKCGKGNATLKEKYKVM